RPTTSPEKTFGGEHIDLRLCHHRQRTNSARIRERAEAVVVVLGKLPARPGRILARYAIAVVANSGRRTLPNGVLCCAGASLREPLIRCDDQEVLTVVTRGGEPVLEVP